MKRAPVWIFAAIVFARGSYPIVATYSSTIPGARSSGSGKLTVHNCNRVPCLPALPAAEQTDRNIFR
jgi:hypothetical protein